MKDPAVRREGYAPVHCLFGGLVVKARDLKLVFYLCSQNMVAIKKSGCSEFTEAARFLLLYLCLSHQGNVTFFLIDLVVGASVS